MYAKGVTSLTQASSIFTINSSLTLSLTSGKVGASVTFSVSGYAAAESVMLNWSPDGVNFVPIGAPFKTSNLGLGGTVATIPDAVSGAHTVKATATTTPVQTATYTVVASLLLSPASGKVGSAATATLRGYGANEVVSVTWAGTALTSLTTDPSGFGTAALKVPETVKGAYAVLGAGTSHSASATYTVAPSMSLSATSGKAGSSVTVTLNGYAANDGITLNWYKDTLTPVALATTPTPVVANSKGTATATVTIPDATNGAHNIEGKTSASSATAPFSVAYSMALTPATGASGSSVSVKLTGFKAYDAVSLNWYATATSFALATTATTNADGTVTATFNVPDGSADGLHKVDAVAGGYSRVNQNYTVTSVAGGPNCALSQAAGPGNTVVTVNCAGFAATEQVKVYWDSTAATALATFTAAAGAGSTTVTIPAAATQGAHALISKGQTSGSSTSDTYTVTARRSVRPGRRCQHVDLLGLPTQ